MRGTSCDHPLGASIGPCSGTRVIRFLSPIAGLPLFPERGRFLPDPDRVFRFRQRRPPILPLALLERFERLTALVGRDPPGNEGNRQSRFAFPTCFQLQLILVELSGPVDLPLNGLIPSEISYRVIQTLDFVIGKRQSAVRKNSVCSRLLGDLIYLSGKRLLRQRTCLLHVAPLFELADRPDLLQTQVGRAFLVELDRFFRRLVAQADE
ncbi:hypothetical protein D3C87_1368950 [compost metagenome]